MQKTKRRGVVTASFIIWMISIVLGLIMGIVLIVLGIAVAAKSTPTDPDLEPGIVIAVGVLMLVLSLVMLLFVTKMRNGRNWARMTLTVLGLLQVASNLVPSVGGGQDQTGGTLTITVGGWVVTLVAIILMWVPSANQYFGTGGRQAAKAA